MTQVIALIAIVATLSIGHMHRKQMRQIELHREDPKQPLKPPPGPLWNWLSNNSGWLIALLPVGNLIALMHDTGPITRHVILDISINAMLVGLSVGLYIDKLTADVLAHTSRSALDLIKHFMEAWSDTTKGLMDVQKDLAKRVEGLSSRDLTKPSDKS